jgi:hypothetical protein
MSNEEPLTLRSALEAIARRDVPMIIDGKLHKNEKWDTYYYCDHGTSRHDYCIDCYVVFARLALASENGETQ